MRHFIYADDYRYHAIIYYHIDITRILLKDASRNSDKIYYFLWYDFDRFSNALVAYHFLIFTPRTASPASPQKHGQKYWGIYKPTFRLFRATCHTLEDFDDAER